MYNPTTRHILLSRDVRWHKWNTKDHKATLREHRQVYMQSLVNQNPNGWSDHQAQQFNDLQDHYLHPPSHPPLPDMPEILDYANYDQIREDGLHLMADTPNEEEEPPHQNHNFDLENQDEEVEVQEIEDEEEEIVPPQDQGEEEHEELDTVEDSNEEEQTRPKLRVNRELRNLGVTVLNKIND
jgi:hypothetical protein